MKGKKAIERKSEKAKKRICETQLFASLIRYRYKPCIGYCYSYRFSLFISEKQRTGSTAALPESKKERIQVQYERRKEITIKCYPSYHLSRHPDAVIITVTIPSSLFYLLIFIFPQPDTQVTEIKLHKSETFTYLYI